jgi:type I restriction enzyme, S subunit
MLKRKLKAEKLNDISIDIPVEWNIRKLEEILKVRHGRNQHQVVAVDGEFPIFGSGGQIGKATKYLYDKPSVLIGRKGTIDVPRYIETPFWTIDTLFYTEINVLAFPKFVYYKFQTIDWYSHSEASGVPSLRSSTIESLKIALPPLLEQQRIAVILSSLDALIQISSQVLKQLETVKRGVMQQLLTRGMPAKNRKFKQTELGEIPLEWEEKTLKNLGKWSGGGTPSKQKPEFWENGTIPWISPKDMYTREIVDAQDWITEEAVKASATNVYPVGSVLVVTRSGVLRHTLPIARLKRLAAVNQDLKVLVVNSNIDSKYVHYFLESSSAQILQACVKPGTTVESIETMLLLAFPIPLPPLEEQQRIVTILSSFDARIRLEEKYKTSLEALKKGLMQQLLSGKLDAREITLLEGKT